MIHSTDNAFVASKSVNQTLVEKPSRISVMRLNTFRVQIFSNPTKSINL